MSEYAFEGEVVKLNLKDFTKWRDMYPALDLTAELIQIDEEFSIRAREGEKLKKWFSECYARLNGRNKIAARNYLSKPLSVARKEPGLRDRTLQQQLSDTSWADGIKTVN